MATTKGRIKAISISEKRGMQKTNVSEAELKTDFGIVGNAHAANWHRLERGISPLENVTANVRFSSR